MQCSVVIPCHGGAELTAACVDALAAQDAKPDEILLVDNASDDATPTLDGRHGLVRVLRQDRNLGFAGGVNQGIREARGTTVLVLNNDTRAATNLLRELHEVLATDPRIAAVGPVSNHVKGRARLPLGALGRDDLDRAHIAQELAMEPARIQDVDTLAGLCLLVERRTFDRFGVFDERFGHGNFEDDDFCLRLRLAGRRLVIARRAFLHHEGHATFRAMGLDVREEISRRLVQFRAKWARDPAGRAAIAALHGDLATAAHAAHEAQVTWPHWPDADWHLARWHLARGAVGDAIPHLETLLRACPRHTDAAVELVCARLATGDPAAAESAIATTLGGCHVTAAEEARVLRARGERWYRDGDGKRAADAFAAAAQLAPPDGGLHNWLGLCRLAAGDLDAAAESFGAAIAAGCAIAHTNLGIARLRSGALAAAHDSFATAVRLLPEDRTARENLAAIERLAPVS